MNATVRATKSINPKSVYFELYLSISYSTIIDVTLTERTPTNDRYTPTSLNVPAEAVPSRCFRRVV